MNSPKRLISYKETCRRSNQCRTSIWKKVRDGTFPKPVKIGERQLAFVEDEVDDWIAALISERDGGQADA
ncbi:MAG: AlpA family phage regulatory protein [Gimesia chilikensis]